MTSILGFGALLLSYKAADMDLEPNGLNYGYLNGKRLISSHRHMDLHREQQHS